MGGKNPPAEPELSELHDRLQSGIRTCRSVVDNYRSLLTEDQHAAEPFGGKEGPADGQLPPPNTASE
jgi:hypothetical protein